MKTLSMDYEIKEKDKKDGLLDEVFKNNAEASFGKMIMDFVKQGNELIIKKVINGEVVTEVEEDVEAVDSVTGETTIVKEKIKKDAYNCTALVQVISREIKGKKTCTRTDDVRLKFDKNQVVIQPKIEFTPEVLTKED